jgi:MinD-like ATPase involved in chromosome partitioning or flagellar assembly
VRAIGAKQTMDGGRKLTDAEYARVAQAGFDNCDFMYVDTPNEISGDQCLALLHMAHLIVFTANIGEQESLRQLGSSMQTLRNFGLADKVNNSIVLINNLPDGSQPTDYLMYQHEIQEIEEVDTVVGEYPGHNGPWIGIQHDSAMADGRSVVWEKIKRETAQDIRRFNITVLQQLAEKAPLRELKRSVHPQYQPHSTSDLTER